ncbi:MAG: response regulator transcription factor [Dehalococcoidia bacterium]|jgi:two-component system response regulator DevR|uniref:response regulator transcription factor n=1 Tax=Candidatus Amarobacter glycogenicus TaxID=3140699 RepID=UPI002A184BEF|nr:response regulator transcription factor [Dehalococcoidia bacterium]MBK6562700.1 response regulator transcription factor [Dehalococcoidia bacterium]MBK7126509.1 response regulator transcription factor [Dehalococcoidia bacterium]MBK7329600.1 response regulator transcription factor [Dehalococcoidia bacterium]MBK8560873.1 response regulator transcription factor [Dehalococcoidia bacterium]
MSESFRVLLADDHDIVRQGLKSVLRGHPEFNIVAEARDGEEAVREAKREQPDLVVMDVRMPKLGGIEACREIRSAVPGANVLMLTSYSDETAVMAAIVAGASGFMLKEVNTADLIEAMRTVARGGKTLDPASSATVIEQIRRGNVVSEEDRMVQTLTEREQKILELVAEGQTNREIGEQLYLSERTVKHHVSDILGKLGLTRRVEAATFAIRRSAKRPPD